MAKDPVVVAFTCDPIEGRDRFPSRRVCEQYWEHVPKWIEAANDIRRRVSTAANIDMRFTWLIRVDRQMTDSGSEPAWALLRYMSDWLKAQERGDELGWMLYPAYRDGDRWRQAYDDRGPLVELVEEGWEAFRSALTSPRAMMMGWRGHRERSMHRVKELGIQVDLSALPGWYTESRLGVVPTLGACDWEVTPTFPYHPSVSDYRRPIVYRGDPALELLELPVTLVQATSAQLRASLSDLLKTGSLGLSRNYRRRRHGVPLHLDHAPSRFRSLAKRFFTDVKPDKFAFSFTCPGATLLARAAVDNVCANLSWLLASSHHHLHALVPLTGREAYRSLTGGALRMLSLETSCGHEHAHHH